MGRFVYTRECESRDRPGLGVATGAVRFVEWGGAVRPKKVTWSMLRVTSFIVMCVECSKFFSPLMVFWFRVCSYPIFSCEVAPLMRLSSPLKRCVFKVFDVRSDARAADRGLTKGVQARHLCSICVIKRFFRISDKVESEWPMPRDGL